MGVLSTLRILNRLSKLTFKNEGSKRLMSDHKVFPLQPSRWQWIKFKDYFHYYVMLGVIPCTLVVTWANIFIGPSTLSEIPEGYTPKFYEYQRSPITRFFAKYICRDPQQEYEKYLAFVFMEDEKMKIRALEAKIKQKMAERNDYQAYYYRPIAAKYHRITREAADYLETIRGE
ncbi:NADH dehydrogenase [ubiquinone] 1 beta subcomplex subunit 5, mitochondrial [Diorhabda carinulata]|uniref:NADH dehydrogenase [ubiquinone] 1 beta subcomplex subunit 5, mitochondrial n=1 Tax=Diorhabda sublineata TaxID=1163346 RepID=UPI0024E11548|nr:NADH dehydrogenase [ubiquinone] 1 beta subcomplex subunit 5, mitochondrial [Diorhabda sublineata]XP_057668030.1 NADH dehydrogenase [ubiquinone] 1 beta subcomplex subunit 5, mitochondrial [Diorhabda carinulata]